LRPEAGVAEWQTLRT